MNIKNYGWGILSWTLLSANKRLIVGIVLYIKVLIKR